MALKGSAGGVRTREASERPCSLDRGLLSTIVLSRLVSACVAALITSSLLQRGVTDLTLRQNSSQDSNSGISNRVVHYGFSRQRYAGADIVQYQVPL